MDGQPPAPQHGAWWHHADAETGMDCPAPLLEFTKRGGIAIQGLRQVHHLAKAEFCSGLMWERGQSGVRANGAPSVLGRIARVRAKHPDVHADKSYDRDGDHCRRYAPVVVGAQQVDYDQGSDVSREQANAMNK